MAYVIKKDKHHDITKKLVKATTKLEVLMRPLPILSNNRHLCMPKGSVLQDLKKVMRTEGEAHNIRMAVATLEGVLKEIKKLKDTGVN